MSGTRGASRRPRVVLVREWDAQVGSSGCCGRLGGGHTELCDADTFDHAREGMEHMGAVYRALYETLGDERVELVVVDPRNSAWLVPAIWRDARRRGSGIGETLRQLRDGVGTGSVVVDGKVVHSGGLPDPDAAVTAVLDELAASP